MAPDLEHTTHINSVLRTNANLFGRLNMSYISLIHRWITTIIFQVYGSKGYDAIQAHYYC